MRWLVVATLAVAALVLVAWALWPPELAPRHVVAIETPRADTTPTPSTDGASQETPVSLRGTELDGAIGWQADGSLRIDLALRRRFDHLLTTLGERSLQAIRTGLDTDIAAVASPSQRSAVLEAFDRYTRYLSAVDGLSTGAADATERLARLHALRVERLGAEMALAFFEDEERVDAWATERRALAAKGEVTALADLKLTAEERTTVEQAAQLETVVTETSLLEARGATASEKRAVREAHWGADAAQRLAQLDDERADWQRRLERFRATRSSLERDASLDEKAQQAALEAVLRRDFTEPEQRRVRALEFGP